MGGWRTSDEGEENFKTRHEEEKRRQRKKLQEQILYILYALGSCAHASRNGQLVHKYMLLYLGVNQQSERSEEENGRPTKMKKRVYDGDDEAFRAVLSHGERMLTSSPEGKRLVIDGINMRAPGVVSFAIERTRAIDQLVARNLHRVEQLVVLCREGEEDTRAYRLNVPAHITIFEATAVQNRTDETAFASMENDDDGDAKHKKNRLQRAGIDTSRVVHVRGKDAIAAVTRCKDFVSGRKTMWVCEGMLMQLSEGEVVKAVKAMNGSGSILVADALTQRDVHRSVLETLGEAVVWRTDGWDDVRTILRHAGYHLIHDVSMEAQSSVFLATCSNPAPAPQQSESDDEESLLSFTTAVEAVEGETEELLRNVYDDNDDGLGTSGSGLDYTGNVSPGSEPWPVSRKAAEEARLRRVQHVLRDARSCVYDVVSPHAFVDGEEAVTRELLVGTDSPAARLVADPTAFADDVRKQHEFVQQKSGGVLDAETSLADLVSAYLTSRLPSGDKHSVTLVPERVGGKEVENAEKKEEKEEEKEGEDEIQQETSCSEECGDDTLGANGSGAIDRQYFEPLVRREIGGVACRVSRPTVTFGPAVRTVHSISSFRSLFGATMPPLQGSRLVDADPDLATRVGWDARAPSSWYILDREWRLSVFPPVGMEVDLPYAADVEALERSLRLTLAFFPPLASRMVERGGRLQLVRDKKGCGAAFSVRKYAPGIAPAMQDIALLGSRTEAPTGDSPPPFLGIHRFGAPEAPEWARRTGAGLLWFAIAVAPQPSAVALIDVLTGVPMRNGSVKGTRLSVSVSHAVADGYVVERFMRMWATVHKFGKDAAVQTITPVPLQRVNGGGGTGAVGRVARALIRRDAEAAATLGPTGSGLWGGLNQDGNTRGFRGVLTAETLRLMRAGAGARVQDSDIVAAWIWMQVVNASARHWRAEVKAAGDAGKAMKWFPSISYGVSLRRVHPELELTTGNLIMQSARVCPLSDDNGVHGIRASELDTLLPLRPSSKTMRSVIDRLAEARRGALSRARDEVDAGDDAPGFSMYDAFCFRERRRDFVKKSPTIILNDMTSFCGARYDFDVDGGDNSPTSAASGIGRGDRAGTVFFSTDGLAGASGIEGTLSSGYLDLDKNSILFRSGDSYRHVWTAQFACASKGAAITITSMSLNRACDNASS